ncbi:MAG TPA: hypothetical protein VK891_18250, partial [Euzebyales bacterium]|nr:hypothetical protein [Euzebyales bacterium]
LEINVVAGDGRTVDAAGLEQALTELPGVERVEQVKSRPAMPPGVALPPGSALPPGMPTGSPAGNGQAGVRLRLYCTIDAAAVIPSVVGLLGARDESLDDLSLGRPSLEDLFIHLTGRDLRG